MFFDHDRRCIGSGWYRGYFSQGGSCWPVAAEFDISEGRLNGFSWDAAGPAVLSGWILANRWLVLRKQYERYAVRLIGRQRSRGVISGRWRIGLGLLGRGLFEFWPDKRAADDLGSARENAMMPWLLEDPAEAKPALPGAVRTEASGVEPSPQATNPTLWLPDDAREGTDLIILP